MKKIHLMLVVLFAFAVVTCTSGVASAYLSTEYVGNTMVDLSWTEYKSTDFSKYELYRDGSLIETIRARTVTFYRDTGLTKGHIYNYEIRSYYTTDKYQSDTTSAKTGEVHGTITRDTSWTAASSPYDLTDFVFVRNGANLTIEKGVMVTTTSLDMYEGIEVLDLSALKKGALYADGVSFYDVNVDINGHAEIKNCFFEDASINVRNSNNHAITGNTVLNNSEAHGIYLHSSSNNVITDNTASNNYHAGIFLYNSSNNTIIGNIASHNGDQGITLSNNSSNNNVTDNTASNNNDTGIILGENSCNNVISSNTASNNSYDGIFLDNSSNNVIANNTVSNNNDTGIFLDNSSANTIYNNYFNNTENAYDNGNNTWHIAKTAGTNIVGGPYLGGNYWCDYAGEDLDGDKLGDTLLPYNCSFGIENGGDYHPLIKIEKIILNASKDGYASVKQEIENAENFGCIEISGKVNDKSTGEPIEGAKVEIVKGADPASTTTDAAGSYTITVIIPEGSGRDTREDVYFELPPAEYIITAETFTAEIQQAIEDNNGTVLETFDVPDGSAVLILVIVSKEERIEAFLENVGAVQGVRYIDPNLIGEVSYIPNDPGYPEQWGPRRIQAGGLPNPSAWDWEQGNKNVTIAILDTGVDYNHPDIAPNYKIGGYDWVNDDNDPMDDLVSLHGGHGTHVAGIAAAVIDNNTAVAGIAQCNIVSEKMANEWGSFTVFDEVKAIYDASMQNADVLSMSFGRFGYIKAEEAACHSAWLKGCILVAASGNERGPWVRGDVEDIPAVYPASYEDVIAVGAIDQNDNLWVGSNWGPGQELVAPGVDILSTRVGGGTTYMTGTSMAVPHVSGVAALLKSHAKQFPPEPLATDPWYHLNNKQIRTIMQRTADDLGPPGWDPRFGYGLVNAKSTFRCINVSGNVLEEVLFAPIRNVEVRLTSIEGPPGVYTTNENTTLARITPEGDYYVQVPPGVYSICAMAYGYIPSRGLGGERMELPAFDLTGQLTTEHQNLRLLRLPCTVFGNVTDNITELPINKAHVSLDGPPHIYPPHPNVKIKTETNASGKYRFILTYGVHPGGLYNISVSKSGYLTKTQNFTLNWSNVITDYYKCPLSPLDYNPPIVNFSLPPVPSELPDLTLARDGIQIIFNGNIATISATIHNIGTVDASNIVVQFFDGDPDAGGTQIGTDRKITGIAHDSSGTVQVTWTAIPGTHDIFVRVDPYNTIQEANENNNQAYKQITVSGAKTIYVDDDFTDDPANHRWNTIQKGITDANDGDTVLVYNGTYTETVTLNKTLTLIGDGMPTIDAHGSGDAIHVTADNCTVKGFCCVNAYYAGISVESDNNVIEENTCKDNVAGIDLGIVLSGSSNEIRNNVVNNNHRQGIMIWGNSNSNIIANNTAKYNGWRGISLLSSFNNRITDNDASNNNYDGIGVYYSSNNNEILNNIANYNNGSGIWLDGESFDNGDNIIADNTAKYNGDSGIHLIMSNNNRIANNIANSNSYAGIRCWISSNNILTYNNLCSNDRGIWLHNYSTENFVANNTATSNSYGISVVRSCNNNIYLNNFIDNTDNAYSYNSSNIWHSTSEMTYTYNSQIHTNFIGNYWSDYKGSDTDGDGIGGSAYSIDGDEDSYPLMKPWESYFAL